MSSLQYTIRSVPKKLDEALRREAVSKGKSLNEVVISTLARAKGLKEDTRRNNDFDDLFGGWSKQEGDEFDKLLKDSRAKLDEKLWQQE